MKEHSQAVLKSHEKLALLAEAAQMLNSTIEYEELMQTVLELVKRTVKAQAALVFRYDSGRKNLRIRYYSGGQSPRRVSAKMGQGFVGWVAEHKEPIITNNPTEDERCAPEITGLEIDELHSLICYPLTLRGRFFGVIEAINKIDGEFDQTDLDTLDILSDEIAISIQNAHLYRQAKREALQRKTLFNVSRLLMSSLTLDEVLYNILQALNKVVEFDAGGIYLIDDKPGNVESITSVGYDKKANLHLKIGQGVVGWVARTGKSQLVPDVLQDERYIDARPMTKSEVVVPVKSGESVIGVLNLESNSLHAFNRQDKNILITFATLAAISIERARMHKSILDQKKIEEQLSIARTIQRTFLPDNLPQVEGYEIWGDNIASGDVGGDYYDFIKIVDNQLGIAIADVSGKGIPAALIMAAFRASLIAEIRNNYAIRTICSKVNNLLCESIEPENFVTAIYGVLDTKNSIFTFSNCGHNPGLLVRSDDSVEELGEGGIVLGVLKDSHYEERPIYLIPGDILCLFTDGVTEAENDNGEQFETQRLVNTIREHRDHSADEIGQSIIRAARSFAGSNHIMDDLTVVIIKRV